MSENNKSVNQKCLENILCHLTKLVVLTEHDEMYDLKQLVKMSTSVSAQLLGVCRENHNNKTNEFDNEVYNRKCSEDYEMTSEEIEEYIKSRDGKLSKIELSELIKNSRIDHLQYNHKDEKWRMWNESGKYYEFYEKD